MKDNFSAGSDNYAKYRPAYPPQLTAFLHSLAPATENAWDCGTGNGQMAFALSEIFEQVFATDISQPQIDNAIRADNIFYSIQPAEQTNFTDDQFDLIVVAQAVHWFDFEKFYAEVKRTARKNAAICLTGYGTIEISEEIDPILSDFYHNVVGPYWDKERTYIDEKYKTLPFPFQELPAPSFENKLSWTLSHLIGYLNTWSAVKKFISRNGYNPVDELHAHITPLWGFREEKEVRFPLLLRTGRVK